MSDAIPAHHGAPLPLAFTLQNTDSESVFNTMGDPQDYVLQITNTSRTILKISRNVKKCFSLGIAAGLLTAPEDIKIGETNSGWKLDPKIAKEGNKIFLNFSLTRGRNLKPGQSMSVKLTGLKAQGTDRSHGTVVALRYKEIDPDDADGNLSGFITHHMAVIHTFPLELWRLDQKSRKAIDLDGRVSPVEGLERAVARIHDGLTPPLILEGGGLVGPGASTLTLTLRANPKVFGHIEASARKPIVLAKNGLLALHSHDADVTFDGDVKVTGSTAGWSAIPTEQDKTGEVQTSPRSDCPIGDGQAALSLSVALAVSGAPRRCMVQVRCEGVSMGKIEYGALDLSVPLLIGPISAEGETLAVHDDIGFSEGGAKEGHDSKHPVRIYAQDGMNVTIPASDEAGFRVGGAGAQTTADLTNLVVTWAGAIFGAFKKATSRKTVLELRSPTKQEVGIELQQSDEKTGFSISVNDVSRQNSASDKRGLVIRDLGQSSGSAAVFVQEGTGHVSIGTRTAPRSKLDVDGRIMDQTGHVMPPGAIVMWSGSVEEIPPGWILCDGNKRWVNDRGEIKKHTTLREKLNRIYELVAPPDLQDRFIVGAGSNYSVEQKSNKSTWKKGRNNTHMTLQEGNMPAHQHTGFIGKKNKSGQINPKHPFVTNVKYVAHTHSGNGYHNSNITAVGMGELTKVPITIDKGPTSAPKSIDIRPHYFALCFIMKL